MYPSLLQHLTQWRRRWHRRWRSKASDPTGRPLMDEARLAELAAQARTLPGSLLGFERPSAHPLIGESVSPHRGRGFEFIENRSYQPGDEPRLLNWRLYARTGQLYTRVFAEERRPQVFIVADRRAAMRFGTRRRLKVTLAVEIALAYAFQARDQAVAVGALVLDRQPQWFTPALGENGMQGLLRSLVSPCPPLAFEADQPTLDQSLRELLLRIPAGCFVLLLSDFADLDADAAAPLLQRLGAEHTVTAVQVLDPVEQRLPDSGDFLIEDRAAPQPLRVHGADAAQRARYAEAFRARQAKLTACFRDSRIPLKSCTTEDDLDTCLELFHVAHGH